jgi:hypothetical protein
MVLDAERSQWNDDERDVLRDNTAQAIHEQLETQDNLKPKYERRWIWELFQNALDAAGNRPKRYLPSEPWMAGVGI